MIKPTHKASGKLFADPETPPARAEGAYTANIDGAARGNPGPAAYGVIVRRPDGAKHESLGKYIGRATNNVAEYYALIAALDYAAASGIKRLRVYSDSQLIVNQIKGLYKVKHPDLRPLHERAKKQAATLETFTIQYVPREQNRDADDLRQRRAGQHRRRETRVWGRERKALDSAGRRRCDQVFCAALGQRFISG